MKNRPRLLNLVLVCVFVFSALGLMPKPVQAASGALRISQVYGGGGNSGAYYTHDFIELFNAGDAPVDLTGWSAQYASTAGSTWQVTPLSGIIPPGGYYLIQQAQGAGGTAPLPTPDAIGTIAMSATNGKVALVNNTTALSGTCPDSAGITDFVGFGSANCYEGSGAAPTLSNTTAALRADGGCKDTDDNAADFIAGAPAPRNTASPLNLCALPPVLLRISQVYGGGGNTGAPYTHDFIEIFNAGDIAVSLEGLSLQYASATGTGNFGATATQLTELPTFTLQPGQYFLVQEAAGAGNGVPLPTPDHIDSTPIAMAAGAGKVALVTGVNSLGCNGGSTPCSPDQLSQIIDLVGYGNANFFEGSAAAPTLSNTTAAFRADGGCTDTDDNAADFTAGAPAPRNTATPLNLCSVPPVLSLRISQVYGGGGNSGAYYTHDFIELFNAGDMPADITGWSVQYASATGSSWQVTPLSGIIPPGGYYLIQQAQGAGGIAPLPTPDAIGAINMSATNGKVALVNHSGALTGTCPLSPEVIDFVGFGSANCYEGSGATPVLSNTTAAIRNAGGCMDTDDNSADFSVGAPTPRNSEAPIYICPLPQPEPTVLSTIPANGAVNVPIDVNIVITFSSPVTVNEPWFDISCSESGSHPATVTDNNPEFTLDPEMVFVGLETCTVTIDGAGVATEGIEDPPITMAEDYVFSFTLISVCGDDFTPIYEIQGSGMSTPLAGQVVSTEGVVIGDFQEGKDGFFIQDPVGDGDSSTSDGIFVYAPSSIDVAVGDHVRVMGTASEYWGLTQIGSVINIMVCNTGLPLPEPVELSLPVSSVDDFEPYEGMLVTFPQALVISEYYNFDRYGEIVLTSTRHMTPTALYEPGPDAIAAAQTYLLDSITLDDGRSTQNPDPAIHPNGLEFTLDNLFRGGDLVANVTGVMDYGFDLYRIQPTQGADYTSVNLRTDQPYIIEGDIKVASFNVLNYFTTIDTGAWICGPSGDMECRGADDANELERQRAKILSAISIIDADVVGLIEIENDRPGPAPDYAVADLVQGLNDLMGAGTYNFIPTGVIGTDAIKLALIYKPAKVTPIGDYAILDSSIDARFLDNFNRPVLAAAFKDNLSEEAFTVAVNHFKSKGSSCAAIGDPDLGDSAGNCNLTRLAAAQALVDWLATDPTGSGMNNFLIIGDLNSYDKEDPIDAIKAGPDGILGTGDDYFDLIYEYLGEYAYSYVFDGQIGYLDYAMANVNFAQYIDDVTIWHINADEPDLIDYDTTFKQPAQQAIYAPDAYRSSDHDPVIITLTFDYNIVLLDIQPATCENPLNVKRGGVLPVAILGTADFDVTKIDPATITLAGVAPLRWSFDDVSTAHDCSIEAGDGYLDLVLQFAAEEIILVLGEVFDGDLITLKLIGRFLPEFGATLVIGEDVVLILSKGN